MNHQLPNFEDDLITVIDSRIASSKLNRNHNSAHHHTTSQQQTSSQPQQPPQPQLPLQPSSSLPPPQGPHHLHNPHPHHHSSININKIIDPISQPPVMDNNRTNWMAQSSTSINIAAIDQSTTNGNVSGKFPGSVRSRSSDNALIRRRQISDLINDDIYTIDEQPSLSATHHNHRHHNYHHDGYPDGVGGVENNIVNNNQQQRRGHSSTPFSDTARGVVGPGSAINYGRSSVNGFTTHHNPLNISTQQQSSTLIQQQQQQQQPNSRPSTAANHTHRAHSDHSLRSRSHQTNHQGSSRHRSYSSYPHRRLPMPVHINYPSEW